MKQGVLCLTLFYFILVSPLHTQEVQQIPVPVAEAIGESMQVLVAHIRYGSMIVVFGIQSPTTALSDYITNEVLDNLVSKGEMKIVDRQNPDLIVREHEIQLSGNVDDAYWQGIGHQFGGEIIITGSITKEGEYYQLRLQALNVKTAQVLGRNSRTVLIDNALASLLDIKWNDPNAWKQKRLYIGVRGGADINFYRFGKDITGFFDTQDTPLGFHGAIEAGIQITDFFALQVDLLYTRDTVKMIGNGDMKTGIEHPDELKSIRGFFSPIPGYNNTYFSAPVLTLMTNTLLIPVMAKVTVRPSIFEFSGLAGIYFTVPLGNIEYDFSGWVGSLSADGDYHNHGYRSMKGDFEWDRLPLGLMAGANIGIKIGPGVLFTDIRFMMDFMSIRNKEADGKLKIDGDPNLDEGIAVRVLKKELFERQKILIGLGYRIGISDRKNKSGRR